MDNYIAVLKKYSDFESKSSRKEYWMFVLFNIIFSSIATLVSPKLSMLYSLLIFIPALAVTVRRLHDIGKSGLMIFIAFIPFIGVFWLLFLLLKKGDSCQDFTSNDSSSNTENNQKESPESRKSCCSDNVPTDSVDPHLIKEVVKITEQVNQFQENIDATTNMNTDDIKGRS
jgi:uncharacterized membrane protein YhaH (DUF805 family)